MVPPETIATTGKQASFIDGIASCLLVLLAAGYAFFWFQANWEGLTDVMRHHDDARTHLMAFHRYGPEGALRDDPAAIENLRYATPLFHLLYRVLVPRLGLQASAKCVQGLCFALLFLTAAMIAAPRRGNWVVALLFLFLVLHTSWVTSRTAGGLQRSFAFPTLALWAAGALAARPNLRLSAIALGALTYPVAFLLVFGAEILFRLIPPAAAPGLAARGPWLPFGAVAAFCCAVVLAGNLMHDPPDRPPWLSEIAKDPAYYKGGRTEVLPFRPARRQFERNLLAPLQPAAPCLSPQVSDLYSKYLFPAPVFWSVVALAILGLSGRAGSPWAGLCLAASAVTGYYVARLFAFRLHIPERFTEFGLPIACIATLAGAFVRGAGARSFRSPPLPALAALALALGIGVLAGWNLPKNRGNNHCKPVLSPMLEAVRRLPPNVRIAGHPGDLSDLPFWTARAVLCGRDLDVPWAIGAWKKACARVEDSLASLYSTNRQDVIAFAARHGVTHLLLRRERFGPAFREESRYFQPFDRFLAGRIKDIPYTDLACHKIPPEAAVFQDDAWILVDVSLLAKAWGIAGR